MAARIVRWGWADHRDRPGIDAVEWRAPGTVTAAQFRRLALALDAVVERAHHHHPDFRVGGRIFATLGYPDRHSGMVVLTPDQQREYVDEHPDAFAPAKGKWGEQGSTIVRLGTVDEETLGQALTLAWQNAASKRPPARGRGAQSRGSARRTARKTLR